MQRSFAEVDGFRKQRQVTRREVFLAEMARVVRWRRLEALIEPHYPKAGNGRLFGPRHGGRAARHARPAALCGPGRWREPDARRDDDPRLRHLLEAHQLAESLFQEVVSLLTERGLILREGSIVDATLIAAPPSTKSILPA